MQPKYLQFNCREVDELDLRQANAVLKHRPDIIILEYPNNNKTPDLPFNKYEAKKKPKGLVQKRLKDLPKEVLKIQPWAKADTIMWKNVAGLWQSGHQVMVYTVDAPSELTGEWLAVWRNTYPSVKKNWVWWVQIYLREKIMAENIRWILKNYEGRENPVVLVFLQSFHWTHVKFLLTNPTKNEIWQYYFGRFSEINRSNIAKKIKRLNPVFYRYWNRVANF